MANVVLAALLVLMPGLSFGQMRAETGWEPGQTAAVFVGGASAGSSTAGVAGAVLGWELARRFAIEGGGMWLARDKGIGAFAAVLGTRVNLLPPRAVMPSVFGGVGMFRASVDRTASEMPDFYRRRIDNAATGSRVVFQDVALASGFGVDVYLGHRIAIRPDVRVLWTVGDSRTRAVTVYGMQLTYHFEEHTYLP
jgi:hypothetical protein